jgi:hypothetical protein
MLQVDPRGLEEISLDHYKNHYTQWLSVAADSIRSLQTIDFIGADERT